MNVTAQSRGAGSHPALTDKGKALTSLLTVVKKDRDLSGQTCEETGIMGLMQGEAGQPKPNQPELNTPQRVREHHEGNRRKGQTVARARAAVGRKGPKYLRT